MKFGEMLTQDKIISQEQLQAALDLQRDNPTIPIGEILMTQGILSRDQLLFHIERYIYLTGIVPDVALEMLDQEEIDQMVREFEEKKNK